MSSVFPTVMPHHERMLAAAKAERERDQKRDALSTAPFDLRFPNQNQTRYCYQSFLDLKRCNRLRGEDYDACKYFKRVVTSMCPKDWVEKWNNQIEEGVFIGKI